MHSRFDGLDQIHSENSTVEFWFFRDLWQPLGSAWSGNIHTTIQRVIEFCKTTRYEPEDHFLGVTQLIPYVRGGPTRDRGLSSTIDWQSRLGLRSEGGNFWGQF